MEYSSVARTLLLDILENKELSDLDANQIIGFIEDKKDQFTDEEWQRFKKWASENRDEK